MLICSFVQNFERSKTFGTPPASHKTIIVCCFGWTDHPARPRLAPFNLANLAAFPSPSGPGHGTGSTWIDLSTMSEGSKIESAKGLCKHSSTALWGFRQNSD